MPKKERVAQKEAAVASKGAAAAAAKDAADAAAWDDPAANKKAAAKAAEQQKALDKQRAKAEAERQLALEAAEASKQKVRGAEKVAKRQSEKAAAFSSEQTQAEAPVLVGRGIDAALAVLNIAEGGGGGGGGGGGAGAGGGGEAEEGLASEAARDVARAQKQLLAQGAGLVDPDDKHPERRMKAAYERFEEREFKGLREDNPGLKRSQLLELLHKMWEKSPENPMVAARRLKEAEGKWTAGGGGNSTPTSPVAGKSGVSVGFTA